MTEAALDVSCAAAATGAAAGELSAGAGAAAAGVETAAGDEADETSSTGVGTMKTVLTFLELLEEGTTSEGRAKVSRVVGA